MDLEPWLLTPRYVASAMVTYWRSRAQESVVAVAIVQTLLHAPHLPVGHPISRPRAKPTPSQVLGQIGQILQANAPVVTTVTGRMKSHGGTTLKEQALAYFIGYFSWLCDWAD